MREIETFPLAGGSLSFFRFGEGATPLIILPGLSLHPIANSASAIAGAYRAFQKNLPRSCLITASRWERA